MRAEFLELISGWRALDDTSELARRIIAAQAWANTHGPLEADEAQMLKAMREYAYRGDVGP